MKHLQIKFLKLKSVFVLGLLIFSTACVMTPDGEILSPPLSASVNLSSPYVITGSRSRVRIALSPKYSVSDAYVVARTYCHRYGYYAVPSSRWVSNYHSRRELVYYCRKTASPDIVTSPRHRHRGRRHYNNRRHHRSSRYNVPRPNRGWWDSNNKPSGRSAHEGRSHRTGRSHRAKTPYSPWSYNRSKDSNKKPRGRNVTGSSPWSYNRSKDQKSPRNDKPDRKHHESSGSNSGSSQPGWWSKNKK